MTLKDLNPAAVWNNFHGLTLCPRPSKHEEKVRAYLLEWGKAHNVETFADETGNVIMRVPATPGYENRKGVILQGHMDMVPQKDSGVEHDFEKDPVSTVIEGDWVHAKGTTLGADDGLGVAMAMAVAESKDLAHGPVEVLVTYDEETGMTGAKALKPGLLKGDILINLDSETEGELYVGCAGGLDANANATYGRKDEPEGYECWTLAVRNCRGGHSGIEIVLCRANANKLAARILLPLLADKDVKLIDLEGGTLRNAIPRECVATVYVPSDRKDAVNEAVCRAAAEIRKEYAASDPDMEIVFEPYKAAPGTACDHEECKYVEEKTALGFIRAIVACPDGVERMSDAMPGLVETSNNMATVRIYKGEFSVKSLIRSSVDSAKDALAAKLESVFALAGVKTSFSGSYGGWAPDPDSEIVGIMKKVYERMFGKEPAVMAIHAGLECGILSESYPNWDMVSIGPTIISPHTPCEKTSIESVQKSWEFLKEVLKSIPEA